MVNYMSIPQVRLTIGGTVFNILVSADVTRNENGFDVATVNIADTQSENYPSNIAAGKTILIEAKDASDASWTTIFNGLIRFCLPNLSLQGETIVLKCDGTGYGLTETTCNQEYGVESRISSLDTVTSILTSATWGVIPKYVNCILGTATSSGYTYDYSKVESIAGAINFVCSPYQPCDKLINDLCDLVTAIRGDAAYHPTHEGPHWIVDTSGNFRMKLIGATQAGWTQYYGDSQTNATLEQAKDFLSFNFEHQDSEANFILFYGTLRKPARDYWTENQSGLWGKTDEYITLEDDADIKKVGDYSLGITIQYSPRYCWIPSGKTAAWDFTKIGSAKNPPTLNFYYRASVSDINLIQLHTDANNYFYHYVGLAGLTDWEHFSLRVGPYYRPGVWDSSVGDWVKQGAPSWSNINYIQIRMNGQNGDVNFDDLHFEGLICRAAKDSTLITADKLKLKTIIDQVGKDDSMKATIDTGTMARLCAAELLSARTKPLIGQIVTPMIKDLLPGQYLHVHSKKKSDGTFNINEDMRVTTFRHHIDINGLITITNVTNDLKNSSARQSYRSYNEVAGATRPEYQDRTATSIKAGIVDIDVPILEKDYPS